MNIACFYQLKQKPIHHHFSKLEPVRAVSGRRTLYNSPVCRKDVLLKDNIPHSHLGTVKISNLPHGHVSRPLKLENRVNWVNYPLQPRPFLLKTFHIRSRTLLHWSLFSNTSVTNYCTSRTVWPVLRCDGSPVELFLQCFNSLVLLVGFVKSQSESL